MRSLPHKRGRRLGTLAGLVALFVITAGAAAQSGGAGAAAANRAELVKAAVSRSALAANSDATAAVVLEIKEGYHAQSHTPSQEFLIPFTITVDENEALTLGEPIYPPGEDHEYPALGKLNVYTGRVVVRVPIQVTPDAKPALIKITGKLRYQICDARVCYPPQNTPFEIKTEVAPAGTQTKPNEPELFGEQAEEQSLATAPSSSASAPPPSAVTPKAALVVGGSGGSGRLLGPGSSILLVFGIAFVAGLLFNVMPCVLPVLPIKAMGFYQAAQQDRGRSVMLGLVFSLGLISVFAALALIVLVFKLITWGELFSQGWFVWTIVVLLIAFALSLFGLYDFRLPVGAYSFQPSHDTFSGNFLLGIFTAILATPCTAPLLPPVMLWATAQPAALGVAAMVIVGVGMAFPYFVLSAFPEMARRFPRTGAWSELFKQMMGFMLLVAAAFFAGGRLVHGTGFWWIVTAVVAVACVYLVARTVQLTANAGPVAVSSALTILLLGGTLWWTAGITGLTARPAAGAAGAVASWEPYSAERFESLRAAGKPVLVKFTANWCATCQYIEGTVFTDPTVWNSIRKNDVVALKVDLTESDAPGHDLLLKLNPAGGIPLTAVYGPAADQPVVLESTYLSGTLLAAIDQVTSTTNVAAAR